MLHFFDTNAFVSAVFTNAVFKPIQIINKLFIKSKIFHCFLTGCIENVENFAISLIGNSGFAFQIVRFDSISSGYPVFADQYAQVGMVFDVVDLFGFSLDQKRSERIITNCILKYG